MVDNKVKFSDSSVLEAVSTAVKAAVVEAAALDVPDNLILADAAYKAIYDKF